MAKAWYAISSHPNKENLLWKQLEMRGVENYFPQIKVNPVNPRARKVKAYFPGYLFVRADLDEIGLSTFKWMPYAKSLVNFGDEPPVVPDALINTLKKKLNHINESGGEIFIDLEKGDLLKVNAGPFEGYEAIFDIRLDGTERVRILLKMLSEHYVPVELDVGQIEKQKKSSNKS